MNNDNNDLIDAPALMLDRSSGRVTWDDRGNSVWEWQTEPGVYSRDADTQRVRVLQVADLELLEAQARGNEHTFTVSSTNRQPARTGAKWADRTKIKTQNKLQSSGLLRRLIGR